MNSSDNSIVITCLHPNKIYQFGPPKSYYVINIPIIVINFFLMVLIVFGNMTVILAYFRNKNLQSIPNMLLITLAFTDLFVGVLALPLFLAILFRNIFGAKPLCWLALLSSVTLKFSAGASFMTLSLINALERYFAICHPFKHRIWITKRKVKRAILILWTILLTLSGSLILGIDYHVYFLILSILTLIGLAITSFACIAILIKLKKRRQRHISVQHIKGRLRSHSSASTTQNEVETRDYKVAITMFYIIGAVVVCYTPMFAAIVYAQVKNTQDELYLKYFYPIAMTLVFLNSLLNPVIYCLRNRHFTNAIRKISEVARIDSKSSASKSYTISV